MDARSNETNAETPTIIGIGSSAGGLEAIRELVANLTSELPVSYVVVQHMSPHHKSLMTELVARQTNLVVKDVEDGVAPEAGTIYIAPPNTDILMEPGVLRLVDPSPEIASPKPLVDRFLISLAGVQGERSVAVILSGTGSDGAYGVQAIREAGGITIAQDGDSAKYDGMPTSAVQTGCVDLILSPVEIGTHLKKILSSPRDFHEFRKGELEQSPMMDLIQILLARTRVDFREYKQTTIGRRIERRMVALGMDSIEEYTQFCRNNPHAVDALYKDLLISVTRFFRDPEEFNELKRMIPRLVDERSEGPLRVWIAGCATGEEVYSIAMLLAEAYADRRGALKDHVQIFATDIDQNSLQVARRGLYGIAALNDIPKELSEKYTVRQNDGIRVVEALRAAILFSHHNVCQDPPFQKIDLLCCRNVLIYFGNSLQQKVMARFHYAMSNRALLFLGTAETVAGSDELFVRDNRAAHVYRRRSIRAPSEPPAYRIPSSELRYSGGGGYRPKLQPERQSTDRLMFDALVQLLGRNSLLVTDDYSIARIHGNVSDYVEMSERSGVKMHLDLLRSPLREEARSLITIALKNGEHRSGVRHLLGNGDQEEVRLDVYPIVASDISERAALVVFNRVKVEPERARSKGTPIPLDASTEASERIRVLESEVTNTREALQQTIEELETSNEELQSLNEELQSTNEELQATNEELETSNEELQSTNEELITVNEELQVTTGELTTRSSELTSVLQSAPIPILVLDNALQIIQATTAALKLFRLSRPLSTPHVSQCTLPEGYPALAPICSETLKLGQLVTHEFLAGHTRVTLSASPYFDELGKVLGVTLVSSQFPGMAQELELILERAPFFLMNRTAEGTIWRISDHSARTLGMKRGEAEGTNVYELLDPEVSEIVREGDQSLLASGRPHSRETHPVRAKGSDRTAWVLAERFPYQRDSADEPSVYSIGTDVTDLVRARDAAEALSEQLIMLQELAGVGYWSVDLENESVYWSDEVFRIHGVTPRDYVPELESAIEFYHQDDVPAVRDSLDKAIKEGGRFQFKLRICRHDGTIVPVESVGLAHQNQDGRITQLVGVFRELANDEAAAEDAEG